MAKSQVFPAKAFEIGGGRIVPSPNQFYLTGEDRLRVVSVNAASGVRVTIACRTANPQGDTVAQRFAHVPTADRVPSTEDFSIGDGSLLNVTAFLSAGASIMGQTYIAVQIVRGAGAAAVVLGTILGGYVTRTQGLGFPGSPIVSSIEGGGAIRTITGTLPVAGQPVSETVPTGARWELYAVTANLVTGIGATPRSIYLDMVTANGRYMISPQIATIPQNTTYSLFWSQGQQPRDASFIGVLLADLVTDLKMLAGQSFRITWTNVGGSDAITAPIYTVREWLEAD